MSSIPWRETASPKWLSDCTLYGSAAESGYRAAAPYFTFAFGAWAMLLLFFFYRRRDKDMEALGRLAGIAAGAIAVFKYDLIIDVFVRVFGSGATAVTLSGLTVAAVFAIIALFVQTSEDLAGSKAKRAQKDATSSSG